MSCTKSGSYTQTDARLKKDPFIYVSNQHELLIKQKKLSPVTNSEQNMDYFISLHDLTCTGNLGCILRLLPRCPKKKMKNVIP